MKVLVVDDETIERQTIIKILKQNKLIDNIIEAKNGREAISFALKYHPQLIIMDIKMPGVNGLDASQAILLEYNPRIIIISAYADFKYAQEAIQMGACDYILKPVRPEKLQKVTQRIIKDIGLEEKASKAVLNQYEKKLYQHSPHLEKDLVYKLIWRQSTGEEIKEQAKLMSITFPLVVMVVSIEDEMFLKEEKQMFERMSFINDVVRESAIDLGSALCAPVGNANVALIVSINLEDDLEDDLEVIDSSIIKEVINRQVKKLLFKLDKLGMRVMIASGNYCKSIGKVYQSYEEAVTALQYSFFMDKKQIIHFEDLPKQEQESCNHKYPLQLENALISYIIAGKTESAMDTLNKLLNKLIESGVGSKELISRMVELVVLISRNLKDFFAGANPVMDEISTFTLQKLCEVKSLNLLKELMKTFIFEVSNNTGYRKSYSSEIDMILSILHEKYNVKLSLDDLSRFVHMNPCYISKIFKEQVGETISDYVTNLRISKAQKMLLNKDEILTISEIAFQVGYEDPNYFSRIF